MTDIANKREPPLQRTLGPDEPLSFPKAMALFTCLSKAGWSTDDLYLSTDEHPVDKALRISVVVRPPEARGVPNWKGRAATIFCELADPALSPDHKALHRWLQLDGEKWNTFSQEQREAHLHKYMSHREQTAAVMLLAMRGLVSEDHATAAPAAPTNH